jgi:hypothetical protein
MHAKLMDGTYPSPFSGSALHFADTNLFMIPSDKRPNLSALKPVWVTEPTQSELAELLGADAAQRALADCKVLDFKSLYESDPGMCPVYYSYIAAMFNPANLGVENFWDDLFMSKLHRGEVPSSDEEAAYKEFRKRSSSSQKHLPDGREKPTDYLRLEAMAASARKKARRGARDKHPNRLNDIRSMALMLYNALRKRENTTFYTADTDALQLMITWVDSMSMRFTMIKEILKQLSTHDRKILSRGRTVNLYFNYAEFVAEKMRFHRALLHDNSSAKQVEFVLKLWQPSLLQFQNDHWLSFGEEAADCLSNMHSNYWCFFSPNPTQGNWLRYNYHWPPEPGETRLRVEVARKTLVRPGPAPLQLHDVVCEYRKEEAAGNAARWSDFVAPTKLE